MIEKNIKKLEAKKIRGVSGFNTGTRTHKSAKWPTRSDLKANLRRMTHELY